MSTVTTGKPPAPPLAVPRLAPRRRSFLQGALALLLIVAGALTAGYVVQRIGATHDYLAVGRPIGAGAEITAPDLIIVRVNSALGLRPIPASQAREVVGKHAVMALVPGTLLTMDQLTDESIPGPGKQLVGLLLKEDRMPAARVRIGASAVLVVIPDKLSIGADKTPELVPPRTIAARIVDVKPGHSEGETLVNVEVATADAPTVAAMAADDRIALALTGA
jgi:SAF domain